LRKGEAWPAIARPRRQLALGPRRDFQPRARFLTTLTRIRLARSATHGTFFWNRAAFDRARRIARRRRLSGHRLLLVRERAGGLLLAEDNDVRFSPEVVNTDGNNPWIVPYSGARVVIRHNTIVNSQLEIYRVRPGALGCQSSENYDNAFSAEGLKMGRPQGFIFIAGGAVLVFNNTVMGTTYNTRTIQVSHERSFGAFGEFGICDGRNPMDGNQIPVGRKGAGYPAFGQPGRATDADGDGVFEPAPCYTWNNTLNGSKLNMVLRPWANHEHEAKQAEHVKEGRDFFNEKPCPEYYRPYIYPHPLQEGWDASGKSAAASTRKDSGSTLTQAPADR
jgi:hypothetical protein